MISHLPILVPLVYLVAAFTAFLLGLWRPRASVHITWLATAAALAAAAAGWNRVLQFGATNYAISGWPAPLGIEYRLDGFSGLLALIVAVFGFGAAVFAQPYATLHYPSQRLSAFYALILLLLAGLSGIVLTTDLFNLFVFLEISSLATYALVAGSGPRGAMAAFRYLILGTVGGSLYLLGVGFLFLETGLLSMGHNAAVLEELRDQRAVLVAVVLMTTGLGVKAAVFPLHLWLPDAYAHAPPPVTALIASMGTKVSMYALIRILFDVFGTAYITEQVPLTSALVWLSALGIVLTSLQALGQVGIRRLLAFSSVGQMAYIALGIGLASPAGLLGALLHMVHHAVLKTALFFAAASFHHAAGAERVENLAGLARKMPSTAATVAVALASLVGLPPTGGFFSKWFLFQAAMEKKAWAAVAALVAGGLLAIAYSLRILRPLYLAPPASASTRAQEPPAAMRLPTLILGGAVVALGVLNFYLVRLLKEGAVTQILATG